MDVDLTYRRYFPLLQQHCRRLLGNPAVAQDLAQETFVRFLKARIEGDDRTIVAWLYRTSANLVVDHLRQRRGSVSVEALSATAAPEVSEAAVALRSALASLSTRVSSEVLRAGLLTRVDGLTQPELAEVLEVSERTVRRWVTAFDDAAQSLRKESTP